MKLDQFSCGQHVFTVAHIEDEYRKPETPCAYCSGVARYVRTLEFGADSSTDIPPANQPPH